MNHVEGEADCPDPSNPTLRCSRRNSSRHRILECLWATTCSARRSTFTDLFIVLQHLAFAVRLREIRTMNQAWYQQAHNMGIEAERADSQPIFFQPGRALKNALRERSVASSEVLAHFCA